MCRLTTCRKCGLKTWTGCGQHAEQVMRPVPISQRCKGHDDEPGFFARLFGRS